MRKMKQITKTNIGDHSSASLFCLLSTWAGCDLPTRASCACAVPTSQAFCNAFESTSGGMEVEEVVELLWLPVCGHVDSLIAQRAARGEQSRNKVRPLPHAPSPPGPPPTANGGQSAHLICKRVSTRVAAEQTCTVQKKSVVRFSEETAMISRTEKTRPEPQSTDRLLYLFRTLLTFACHLIPRFFPQRSLNDVYHELYNLEPVSKLVTECLTCLLTP